MTTSISPDLSLRMEQAVQSQRQRERRQWRLMAVAGCLLVISFVLDIATGPSLLHPQEVVRALAGLLGLPVDVEPTTEVIVTSLRLPIALMAVVVGAGLGMGGAEMQTLLNNQMASPYTLGMAAAAGLGAALVLFFR